MYGTVFGLDGTHHQMCGSVSHGVMRETGAMQAFNAAAAAAAQPMVNSHHRGQVPSQYAGCSSVSLPAHQHHVHHSHAVVDNVYASVPGMCAIHWSCFSALCCCLGDRKGIQPVKVLPCNSRSLLLGTGLE